MNMPNASPTRRDPTQTIFHWLALGHYMLALGISKVALSLQGFVGIGNAKSSRWGSKPTRGIVLRCSEIGFRQNNSPNNLPGNGLYIYASLRKRFIRCIDHLTFGIAVHWYSISNELLTSFSMFQRLACFKTRTFRDV